MTNRDGSTDPPRVLNGFDVLPANEPTPARGKPKGKPNPAGNRGARNRFATVNAFLDMTARKFPPSASLVWVLLWRDTKPDGLARTSQDDIAERLGLTPKTVKRAIRALQDAGLLQVVRRGRIGAGPSVYRLFPMPDSAPIRGTK